MYWAEPGVDPGDRDDNAFDVTMLDAKGECSSPCVTGRSERSQKKSAAHG
jgi:hypothetical protein